MASSFEFATAQQILFGDGKAATIAAHAQQLGQRALVVMGASNSRVQALVGEWESQGIVAHTVAVGAEPTVDHVSAATAAAREAACDVIIAIGCGSVIDTGKAVAALLTNPGDPLDY